MRNFSVVLLIVLATGCTIQDKSAVLEEDFVELTGPYLGQVPPGGVPELFAPGIVADIHHEHSAAIFSPDGTEVFWTVTVTPLQSPLPGVIMHSKIIEGVWSKPEIASFSGQYNEDIGGFAPDGQRFFITSFRPTPGTVEPNTESDIWFVKRTPTGWSEPVWLDSPVNTENHEADPMLTRKGNLYYLGQTGVDANGWPKMGVFRAQADGDSFSEPEMLGENINSGPFSWCPYIDPDEEYMIFSSMREDNYGSGDLYISFRLADGTFGEALNLGSEINSSDNDRFPAVSPDGKYLFFLSKRTDLPEYFDVAQTFDGLLEASTSIKNGLSNIYWVDAKIIDELRTEFRLTNGLLK